MIIVTGAAGFIGSRLIEKLNEQGEEDIIAVDDLTDGRKFENLSKLKFLDYVDKDDFILTPDFQSNVRCVFHMGAISSTDNWDGKKVLRENYDYSKELLLKCEKKKIPFIYASSAGVYGNSAPEEKPLTVYGYSKKLLDDFVRRILPKHDSQVVGLRFFNVYGPGEQFKEGQASPFFRYWQEGKEKYSINLLVGKDGQGGLANEHKRDFVYVDDVVDVCLWFMKNKYSGIFDVGTEQQHTFSEVLKTVYPNITIKEEKFELSPYCLNEPYLHYINKIPFPDKLKGKTQTNTKANLTKLREVGYDKQFKTIQEGWAEYQKCLK